MRMGTRLGLGAVSLSIGLVALVGLDGRADEKGGWRLVVPATAVGDLVKDDTKVVMDVAKKAKIEKKDVKLAKVATLSLAVTAEAAVKAGKDADKMAAVHGQAMKVLEALGKDDGISDFKKEAAGLASPSGSAGKGDAAQILWDAENKDYDRDLAMQLFKSTRAGGLGYEKKIKDGAEKGVTAKDLSDLTLVSYKVAMLAQVIAKVGPSKSQGGQKTPENWQKYAASLESSSLEAGEAASKKNLAGVKTALGKIDAACVKCHEIFK